MRMLLTAALLVLGTSARAAVSYPIEIDSSVQLSATPVTLSVTVFSVDDALSETFTLAGATRRSGGKGMIRHLHVLAAKSTTIGFDVMIFSRTFAGTALNEAWAPATGDVNNSFIGKISITSTAWTQLGSGAASAEFLDVDMPYNLPAGQDDLQCQLVIRGGDDSLTANQLVIKADAVWVKK